MAYPPSPPALGKANATPQNNDHPAHHNALAQAIRDIIDVLGTDPAGDSASLTARLLATENVISNDYTVTSTDGFIWATTGDGEYTVTLPSGLTSVKEVTITSGSTGLVHISTALDLYDFNGNVIADLDLRSADSITVTFSPTLSGWFILRQTSEREGVKVVTGLDSYDQAYADRIIRCNPTGATADQTINLLSPADASGRSVTIRRGNDADPDDVVVSGTIDDAAGTITLAAGQSVRLTSDGTTWFTP